jgi:hypothetical protein
MFYADAFPTALATAIDWNLPIALLPLIITNQMASLSGLESERLGCTAWE